MTSASPAPASVVAALAAALLFSGSLLGQATLNSLETSPQTPTWQERVTFTAHGVDCGAVGLELAEVAFPEVRIRQVSICGILDPPVFSEYFLALELPRLEPGRWVAVYTEQNGEEIARHDFQVFETGSLVLEAIPAGGLPQDYILRASGYSCGGFELTEATASFLYRGDSVCSGTTPADLEYFEFEQFARFRPGVTVRGAIQVDLPLDRGVAAVVSIEVPESVVDVGSLCDVTEPTFLCLGDGGRFQATMEVDGLNAALAQPFPPPPHDLYSSTGFFVIFDRDNLEVTVKVLDGCAINGHFWLFASWGTTLQADLTVTDLVTGITKTYGKPADQLSLPAADVQAFPCEAPL